MELRWGGGDINRIRALAQELVGLQPDIIVINSTAVTAALQRVFVGVADLVAALNQPGGNITGFGLLEASIVGKQLELLSEIAPGLKRAAIMFNPDTTLASVYMPSFEAAARSLKVVYVGRHRPKPPYVTNLTAKANACASQGSANTGPSFSRGS